MPGTVCHIAVEIGEHVVVFGEEAGVVQKTRPVGRSADHGNGVLVAGPRIPIDGTEQSTGPRVPGPVEVIRESSEAFESGREWEGGRGDRRDADGVHEAA